MINLNKNGWSKWMFYLVSLLPVLWAAAIAAQAILPSQNISQMLSGLADNIKNPFDIHWTSQTAPFMAGASLLYAVGVGIWLSTRRKTRPGEEHGSALWGNPRSLYRKYSDREAEKNILLTRNFRLGFDTYKHGRNLNVLVVGGSGSGKTRFYAKPNIMQCNCSFIVTDPKGEILRATGHLLEAKGYDIKVFDLVNMSNSFCYNPFKYIRDDKDVLKLVTNLIRNTTPKSANLSDPFWEKSEIALLQALMLYLIHEAPEEEQNFSTVMELLGIAEVREDDESYQSLLDILFERLEMRDPEHIALKQYKVFKQAAGKTAKSILISVAVRLSAFNLEQIASITNVDEIDISSIGIRKTALFCVIPDNDSSFNYLVGMMYTQAFQELYYLADHKYNGRLPVHVHCMMDEFPNVALPDDFEKILSTVRSREISVSIIIQNIAQLKALFKDSWENITGNCDTLLYFGSNEQSTHEYISRLLGKGTIDTNTYGHTKGRSGSYSTNFQNTGRELLTPDEVRLLNNRYALLFLRGERAILDKKIDILKHPNISGTTDGGYIPYEHGEAPLAAVDIELDISRIGDFELLDDEELITKLESENIKEGQPNE